MTSDQTTIIQLEQAIIALHQAELRKDALPFWDSDICPHCGNGTDLLHDFGHYHWCPICHAQWSSLATRPGMHMVNSVNHMDSCEGGLVAVLEEYGLER